MAELKQAASIRNECCSSEAQAKCCEPGDKAACCGESEAGGGCGCSAGTSEVETAATPTGMSSR